MGTRPRAHVELRYKSNKAVRHYVEEVTLQDNKMTAIKLPQRLLQPWVNISLLGFIRQAYSKLNMRIRLSLTQSFKWPKIGYTPTETRHITHFD